MVGPADVPDLADIFQEIDDRFFRPHPFTAEEARKIAQRVGRDTYILLSEDGQPAAYGMLRGWDEGYPLPTLGIAVRKKLQGRGLGRRMMGMLHDEARRRGAIAMRLRVHPDNVRARRLYESLGYAYVGVERGELLMIRDLLDEPEPSRQIEGRPLTIDGGLIGADAPEWGAMLDSIPHDFYHLPAYVTMCATRERGRACALHLTMGGRAMLLPLIIRDVEGGGVDATSPYGYPGPLFTDSDPDFQRIAMVACRKLLRGAGIVSVFIRLHPILNPIPPAGLGTLVEHGDTVRIDLTGPDGDLWAKLRNNHRRDIVRTRRLGFVARMDEEFRHLDTFKRLYRETMERRGAGAFYFFDDAYFAELRDALGDRLKLCVVERDGDVAAAGLFVRSGSIVEYHLSGTAEESIHLQPTKLMIHHASMWGREQGCQILHLGGGVGANQDSLLHFKLGFSPDRQPFSTLRMVLDLSAYKRLVRAADPGADVSSCDGFFPAYRMDG